MPWDERILRPFFLIQPAHRLDPNPHTAPQRIAPQKQVGPEAFASGPTIGIQFDEDDVVVKPRGPHRPYIDTFLPRSTEAAGASENSATSTEMLWVIGFQLHFLNSATNAIGM